MLSSQSQSPHPHHKRQMSTPMTFNPETATEYFPITYPPPHQQGATHRRGISLDQPMRLQDSTPTNIGNGKVTTNQGHEQQQTMRETQMRGLSRPGQFNSIEDIFEMSPTMEKSEKDFGDFGQWAMGVDFSNTTGGFATSTLTPALPPQNHSRPLTPQDQALKSMRLELPYLEQIC